MNVTRRHLINIAAAFAGGAPPACSAPGPASGAGQDVTDFLTIPTRIYPTPEAPGGVWPVKYRKLLPPTAPRARYPGFRPGRFLLKAGTIRRRGARPLATDIILERDVALRLRDGTTIYADVFRPPGQAKVPAIFAWSPYGKEVGGQWLDDLPSRLGVPLERVSELQRFEGADPAYWCAHGYAVVNPDPRGALHSQGNVTYWGRQMAEDGYDTVEWVAGQGWCTGAVVMSGNSWLAVSQWFIAAERPPHLVAIAPWEGLMEQGPAAVPTGAAMFGEIIIQTLAGGGYVEDQPRMLLENPLMNAFWQDHRARVERIEVPAYIVASYTNMAHTVGTFEAWRRIGSQQKWLRIHNTQEWADYYEPDHVEDLRRFFDHYAKAADNDWQSTPRVRMAVLDPGGRDIVGRAEASFPPERALLRHYYLDAEKAVLRQSPVAAATSLSYDVSASGVRFSLRFDRQTELCGYVVVRLFVQADGSDDMDLVVTMRKVPGLIAGLLEHLTPGPPQNAASGTMRASMRELDEARSTPLHPVLAYRREQKLRPGEIVPLHVALSPMAMLFHPGECLELSVGPLSVGHIPFDFGAAKVPIPLDGLTFDPDHPVDIALLFGDPEPDATRRAAELPPSRNRGSHVLWLGGPYDAQVWMQLIEAGDGA